MAGRPLSTGERVKQYGLCLKPSIKEMWDTIIAPTYDGSFSQWVAEQIVCSATAGQNQKSNRELAKEEKTLEKQLTQIRASINLRARERQREEVLHQETLANLERKQELDKSLSQDLERVANRVERGWMVKTSKHQIWAHCVTSYGRTIDDLETLLYEQYPSMKQKYRLMTGDSKC